MFRKILGPRFRRANVFILTLLAIEFLDELVFGVREAAWPLIRTELDLSYLQIGLLLSLPDIASAAIEPVLGVLGDIRDRSRLILGGGIVFAIALGLIAISGGFSVLLLAFLILYPASGAFVSLSQASLMDADPERRDQQMVRWAFAGSLGVVAGPLILSVGIASGVGWRGLFAILLLLTVGVLLQAGRSLKPPPLGTSNTRKTADRFWVAFRDALKSLIRREVARWLVLLEFADLMWDILHGFLALYFVDVVGVTPMQAGLAIGLWSGMGLLGDFAFIPLLERVRGLTYLRISAVLTLILFPAFLLVDDLRVKLPILALLGLLNAGWYAILKAQLYGAMPGQSGRVMTVGNISGLIGGLIPLGLGLVAQQYNLETAMWLLVLGPLALVLGLRRGAREDG